MGIASHFVELENIPEPQDLHEKEQQKSMPIVLLYLFEMFK